jgi:long-chain fatty acid transport protein
MKKSILSLAFVLASIGSQAGGLVTNTNQNAAFLRNFAQEGQYGEITAIYANPAGGAFLRKGWHLSLNNQVAIQERDILTTMPLFQYNTKDRNATHKFDGDAQALVIPSFTFSYNWDRWSISAHFAVGGGGGKCEFENGLGTFETAYATSLYLTGMSLESAGMGKYTGYTIGKSFMKGSSYFYGLQVGGTYKILDNLSAFVGIRGVYALANYNGFVSGVTLGTTAMPKIYADADMSLNCDQHGFGVTPILGIDWKINDKWNVSAKYEFKTRIRLKNATDLYTGDNAAAIRNATVMKQFEDGAEIKEDIPGILAVGAQYQPIKSLKIGASYHWYQDSEASKFGDMQEHNHDSHEVLAGVEWRTGKWITVSGSWQKTMYNVDDEAMRDASFNLSSNSMGVGMRIHCTKDVNVDFSYMKTFYQDRTVTTALAPGLNKMDTYHRTNDVIGMAVNMSF